MPAVGASPSLEIRMIKEMKNAVVVLTTAFFESYKSYAYTAFLLRKAYWEMYKS